MSTIFQTSRGQRMIAWPAWLLSAGMLISLQHLAAAHDLFTAYIQHRILLTVGARYSDLEVDLTFFEEWSARERTAMDADVNGRISRSEVESYVEKLGSKLAGHVKLRVAGSELALVPLYAPEVDLLGKDQVGPTHHRLKLFFFVPTPSQLRPGDEIVVEDGLWPAAKALGTLQAEGRDDCALETAKTNDPGFAPAPPGEARLFKTRCLTPPRPQPDARASSGAVTNQSLSHSRAQ